MGMWEAGQEYGAMQGEGLYNPSHLQNRRNFFFYFSLDPLSENQMLKKNLVARPCWRKRIAGYKETGWASSLGMQLCAHRPA